MIANKRIVFLVGIAIVSSVALHAGQFTILPVPEVNNDIQSVINKAQTNFFYGANLFNRDLSNMENALREVIWNQALDRLKNYVAQHAVDFLNVAKMVKKTGIILATTINSGYKEAFGGSVGKSEAERAAGYQMVEGNIADLLQKRTALQNYIAELNSTMFIAIYPPPPAKKVADLLLKVLPGIERIIKRVVIDFLNESRIYGFSPSSQLVNKINDAYPDLTI